MTWDRISALQNAVDIASRKMGFPEFPHHWLETFGVKGLVSDEEFRTMWIASQTKIAPNSDSGVEVK